MAKTPKQPKVEDIVRKHETDKCDLCVKPAVIRVTFFGEVQEYVGADGDWRDYAEDSEGYEIYRCVAHAEMWIWEWRGYSQPPKPQRTSVPCARWYQL